MKKTSFGEAAEVFANVGVIVSLVLLAYQLQQNNKLMAANLAATSLTEITVLWGAILEQPGLAEVALKDRRGEELAPVEELRLNALWMRSLKASEFIYTYQPERRALLVGTLRRGFMAYGSMRRTWNGDGEGAVMVAKDQFTPEFVMFMEQNVIRQ